jgi:hypothetical protein
MKKRNNHRLDEYIFDNGKEYLLSIDAKGHTYPKNIYIKLTLSVDNIRDYYSYFYVDVDNARR